MTGLQVGSRRWHEARPSVIVVESEVQRNVYKLIEAVTAPLGFFVLALLIVESFLTAAFLGGELDPKTQFIVLILGVIMFVFVVLIVAILVWRKPENLTFDKQAHLVRSGTSYGTENRTVVDRDSLLPSEAEGTNEE